ncbi:MAG: ATP-binding cassette domain-containing protein [Rhodospirillaceae bacterium]
MSHILIDQVNITYDKPDGGGKFVAVDGAQLSVEPGTFVTIVGPSGCGKSSLLMAIDGLVPISSGTISVNGNRVTGPGHDRAMVFQEFSLRPGIAPLDQGRPGRTIPPLHSAGRSRRI